ncbi:MAG: DNA-3-methyladenine glycosylase 2 family protein [Candidatus Limnocylindrales bacterium]
MTPRRDGGHSAPERGEGAAHASDAVPLESPFEASFAAPEPIDLRLTLAPLRHGFDDPTIRLDRDGVWLARRTAAGPASIRLWTAPGDAAVHAQAWGPGAELALLAAPGLAGLLDDPAALVPQHRLIRELQRRFPGLRLPRTGQLLPALIPAVTEQKVTAGEAQAAYAALARRLGDAAPGPAGLLLPASGALLAALPYFELHPMGLERRRAELIRRLGGLEQQLEALIALAPGEARARLRQIPGIGPWTAAEATRAAFGDPDAVSVGDAHLPDLVAWTLAGEPRGDDARMLSLLKPYRGQRARVVRLLEASRIKVPRFGPRFAPGHIERL